MAVLFAVTSVATGLAPSFTVFIAGALHRRAGRGRRSPSSRRCMWRKFRRLRCGGAWGRSTSCPSCVGVLISYLHQLPAARCRRRNWRWMFITGVIPSAVFFVLLLRAPETPRYLFMAGRNAEALHDSGAHRRAGERGVRAHGNQGQPAGHGETPGAICCSRESAALWRSASAWPSWSTFPASTPIIDYAPTIFRSAGWKLIAALFSTFIVGVNNLVFTLVSFWVIDRYGRKPLYIVGSLGMAAALLRLARR